MLVTNIVNTFLVSYFFSVAYRRKRSPSNPLGFLEDVKDFVSDANSLGWDQVAHNIKSNVGFGVKKVRRVTSHIASKFR